MKKQIILFSLILLTGLLILSCGMTGKDRGKVLPQALVVKSQPVAEPEKAPAKPEMIEKPVVESRPEVPVLEEEEIEVTEYDEHYYFKLGLANDKKGMYMEAAEAYREAIKTKPDYEVAYYNLGRTYLKMGDRNAVHETYMKLRDMEPQMAENLYEEARLKTASKMNSRFAVQVGAFRIADNAYKLLARLKNDFMNAYVEEIDDLHKVRILGMRTRMEGERLMAEIHDKYNIKPFIVPMK